MFNFAWSELAGAIKKARRMASEFQGHVDEMVREANLEGVRDTLSGFRNLNVTDALERAIDPDGGLRSSFNEDAPAEMTSETDAEPVGELGVADMPRPDDADPGAPADAPAFIPPAASGATTAPPDAPASIAPAFIPPDIAARGAR